jgi:hypothetical protein
MKPNQIGWDDLVGLLPEVRELLANNNRYFALCQVNNTVVLNKEIDNDSRFVH